MPSATSTRVRSTPVAAVELSSARMAPSTCVHRLAVGRGHADVGEVEHAVRAGVEHDPVVAARSGAGDLGGPHLVADLVQRVDEVVHRRGLAGVHRRPDHRDRARRGDGVGLRREGEVQEVERGAPVVAEQADRRDVRGVPDVRAAADHLGGDAARGDELHRAEVVGDVRLELVGRVAVCVGRDDEVADVHVAATSVGQLETLVVTEALDLGEHQVAGARADSARDHGLVGVLRDSVGW